MYFKFALKCVCYEDNFTLEVIYNKLKIVHAETVLLFLLQVCRSTKPSILTNHLMLLSATRSTPCCAIFGLSDVMAPLLKMKTVAACGFKVPTHVIAI